MGGTQKYGDIIIKTLYCSGFAIGISPLSGFIYAMDFSKILSFSNIFSDAENLTWANVTFNIKEIFLTQTMNNVIAGSAIYIRSIFFFIFLVFLAILIIIKIHQLIKQRKNEEQIKIEEMLSCIKPENIAGCERDHCVLTLYNHLLNLHEWPVKNSSFIINLVISTMFLFISPIFH
jgi:hypothetical protein